MSSLTFDFADCVSQLHHPLTIPLSSTTAALASTGWGSAVSLDALLDVLGKLGFLLDSAASRDALFGVLASLVRLVFECFRGCSRGCGVLAQFVAMGAGKVIREKGLR
jgi:hypothetical protein